MTVHKLAIIIFAFFTLLPSQKLKSNVSISYDRLSGEDREKLKNFRELLQRYLDDNPWFSNEDATVIQVKLSIFIETVAVNEGKNFYTGQLLLNSESLENFYDKSIKFYFDGDISFNRNSSEYNPLINLLDYYIYMVLAAEMDSFDELGGDPFYNKAQSEVFLGKNNSFSSDWKFRENLLKDALHPQVKPVRIAKLDIYTLMAYSKEKSFDKARLIAKKIIKDLKEVKTIVSASLLLKRFLDAYSMQLLEVLDSEKDQDDIDNLIYLDPGRREEIKKYKQNP